MKASYFLFYLLLLTNIASAQSALEQVMEQIATDLTSQLNGKKAKKVAVTRLDFRGQGGTAIGRYFADELSYFMTRTQRDFEVVPCMSYEEALINQERQRRARAAQNSERQSARETDEEINALELTEGLIQIFKSNPSTVAGVKHTVTGNIIDEGDELAVTFQVLDKRKNIKANARGRFLKTPKIEQLIGQNLESGGAIASGNPSSLPPAIPTPESTSDDSYLAADPISWKNNNLYFEVDYCAQSQQSIECKVKVTVRRENTELYTYLDKTSIFDAADQMQYYPTEIVVGGIVSNGRSVIKPLIANHTADITLRFDKVDRRVDNLASLWIKSYTRSENYFVVELKGIPVQH